MLPERSRSHLRVPVRDGVSERDGCVLAEHLEECVREFLSPHRWVQFDGLSAWPIDFEVRGVHEVFLEDVAVAEYVRERAVEVDVVVVVPPCVTAVSS